MDLKETDILGTDIKRHWYYVSKARAMAHLLGEIVPTGILDVGAGSGFFSRCLLARTTAKEAWCVDISYKADSEGSETGKPIHFRRSVESVAADLLLFMDVLEHVEDEVALLKDYVAKAPTGSHFLVTVPAFNFLWSGHDVFLEHKRRYTLRQLEEVLRNAGLQVNRGAYYFGMVFPIAAAIRLVQGSQGDGKSAKSQLTRHHPIINALLLLLCTIELPFMNLNRTAGLTVFCLAEKP